MTIQCLLLLFWWIFLISTGGNRWSTKRKIIQMREANFHLLVGIICVNSSGWRWTSYSIINTWTTRSTSSKIIRKNHFCFFVEKILSYPLASPCDECDRDRERETDFDPCRSLEWRERLRSRGDILRRR